MDRRYFLAGSAALLAAPAYAASDSIQRLNEYLTNLRSVTATFRQENADGTVTTGRFFLKKPGKMRFEYNAPSDSLVVADGRTLAIFDAKSNVSPQRYPQRRTPLSLLSLENIDVTSSVFVRRIEEQSGRTYMTMFDPEKPRNGQMVMVFETDPMALIEWVLTDKSGLETRVFLDALETGTELNNRLFNIGWNIRDFESRQGG
ncbi:MAG: outer membrane lipoprotein carrier protein LolA [Rhodobacteraceae bacterium]|nr:outer membrane lipoprotein carrier protein LolA [Paracoccaceae bacterium]